MRNLVFRLFFIVIIGVLLFSYIFPWNSYGINVPFTGKDYKLWLDLQWWIELDYKVDLEEAKQEEGYNSDKENKIIEGLKSIIDKRIETLNINDSVITTASYGWEQHIIVQIPLKWNNSLENNENIQKAKEAIWKVVKIEFKERRTEVTQADLNLRTALAVTALEEINSGEYDFSVTSTKYQLNYENVIAWFYSSLEDIEEEYNLVDNTFTANTIIELESMNYGEWYLIAEEGKENNGYLFISKNPSEWKSATDSQGRILNDKYFENSSVQFNEAFQPMIELVFNSDWADIFWELTTRLTGQQIAIFVWGENLTAPNVNEPILSWKAVITWDYTADEANQLSQDINTWVVPAPIYLTSEKTIDSKLWASSLEKLIIAWISWFIIILLFLLVTYRISWLIASVALLIYVVLVLSIVKTLWIVLTMASIAWLILSIGMAIDANILIFERIRDELRKWKKLEEATYTWFKKSWSAIWDSNLTWFIVALILFIFWINLIKWFGLMLAIWIVISLLACFWISRVLIFLLAKWSNNNTHFIGLK